MFLGLIIRLLFSSFNVWSKILESCGAPGWIKMETGHSVFSSNTTVTLKPMKCFLVVEYPHFNFNFSNFSGLIYYFDMINNHTQHLLHQRYIYCMDSYSFY